jgi:hypothetical protein
MAASFQRAVKDVLMKLLKKSFYPCRGQDFPATVTEEQFFNRSSDRSKLAMRMSVQSCAKDPQRVDSQPFPEPA